MRIINCFFAQKTLFKWYNYILACHSTRRVTLLWKWNNSAPSINPQKLKSQLDQNNLQQLTWHGCCCHWMIFSSSFEKSLKKVLSTFTKILKNCERSYLKKSSDKECRVVMVLSPKRHTNSHTDIQKISDVKMWSEFKIP